MVFGLSKARALHITIATLHLVVAAALVAAFADRSGFIQRGRIAIACTSFSSNVTEQQREDLRMVIPLTVDDACGHYDILGACFGLHLGTAVFHAIYAIRESSEHLRWVEYYVSGALVFIHFALTTGTREALVLVLIGFGIATIMPFGYLYELEGSGKDGLHSSLPLLTSTGAGDAAAARRARLWRILILQGPGWIGMGGVFLVILYNYGQIAKYAPNFVSAIVAVQCILLPSFGIINLLHGVISRAKADTLYAIASVTSKIIPTAIFVMSIRVGK